MKKIILTKDTKINGEPHKEGEKLRVGDDLAEQLINVEKSAKLQKSS